MRKDENGLVLRRLRWAWRKTSRTLREHVWWHIAIAFTILVIVELLWVGLHAKWTRALATNAAEALGLTAAAAAALATLLFVWNLLRSGDRMLIEQLQPGPEAAAEERERIRQLRAWVGMLGDEV